MIIKVCGMREPENIRAIEQAGADWMGFIFFPQSARYVSHRPEYLPEQCHRIGVFVNESSENILLKAQEFGLHHIRSRQYRKESNRKRPHNNRRIAGHFPVLWKKL